MDIFNGLAKGDVSEELKEALKDYIEKADNFYYGFFSHNYVIKKKVKKFIFFTKVIESFDMIKLTTDAKENNCNALYSYILERPRVEQDAGVQIAREVLVLASSKEFYLTVEQQGFLNRFKNNWSDM